MLRKLSAWHSEQALMCRWQIKVAAIWKLTCTLQNTKLQQEERAHRVKWQTFFVSKTDTSVTDAEGTLAFHTIKHHNSYRSMDCTSGLLRKIFPDSVTAQKISSAEGDSVHPLGYNFKHMTCKDFHTYLIGNRRLMGKIQSSEKYAQPHEDWKVS